MLLWSRKVSDLPMPQIEKVSGSHGASRLVVGADRGEYVICGGTVEQDDRHIRSSQLGLLFPAQRGYGVHQNAVDALLEQGPDVVHLLVRIEVAIAKDQIA